MIHHFAPFSDRGCAPILRASCVTRCWASDGGDAQPQMQIVRGYVSDTVRLSRHRCLFHIGRSWSSAALSRSKRVCELFCQRAEIRMKLDIPNDSQRLLMLSHERRMNFVPMPLKLFD
jgi:hypothetical protein